MRKPVQFQKKISQKFYFLPEVIKHFKLAENIEKTGIWNDYFSGYCELSEVTTKKRNVYNKIINENLHLMPHVQEKINKFKEENKWGSKKILGVHCRGTDGISKQSPELYYQEILTIEKNYDSIFVITDDQVYISYLKSKFGSRLMYREESLISQDGSTLWLYPTNPYSVGEGAVIDAYLLAETQFMICPSSNVSHFSRYLNINLEYINIYKKYNIPWT